MISHCSSQKLHFHAFHPFRGRTGSSRLPRNPDTHTLTCVWKTWFVMSTYTQARRESCLQFCSQFKSSANSTKKQKEFFSFLKVDSQCNQIRKFEEEQFRPGRNICTLNWHLGEGNGRRISKNKIREEILSGIWSSEPQNNERHAILEENFRMFFMVNAIFNLIRHLGR